MKTILRKNGTRKVSIDCSKPIITDQSYKKSQDINNIMLQYAKTRLLPSQKEKVAQYIDNTEIPSLMESYEQLNTAKQMFMELPAQIRKLMDNDPTKIIDFIKNPENQEVLLKYNVIELKEKPKKVEEVKKPLDPPAVASE